ncbi:MAG TPA: 1-deoxy-D-xylulose-5-phosphate synthase [bacterium]|jgi:1-deoxy-D-xylulose-5-phosphate synthase|nr:1-deoxy-D-xylulose-5-phosphate synthase [bacterium]
MSILEGIASPADLKDLDPAKRRELAAEIRQLIVRTVSKNGGHLATNLGAVELTLAVHTVFDSPNDRIVLDTGHQGYTHKLVTGRTDRFHTLRQMGGLSGFLKRDESPHDSFGAGHAATSISAAGGMARARDLLKTNEHVVCIIGDSSIPNGMAFEALNDLGHRKTDLLVILNDNEMSISRPVGALSHYLSRIITGKTYTRFREQAEHFIKGLPAVGKQVAKLAHLAEEFAKSVISPGMFFEELGFTYVGPVDGHDCEALIGILRRIRTMKGPVLLHTVTRKGKGFAPAEKDPVRFHGPKGFDIVTGEMPKPAPGAPQTWSAAFSQALLSTARQDPRVAVITPAMIEGSSLQDFEREIPARLFDVGIAEEHSVTLAAGMATRGLRPVVAIYSTFFQRGLDQAVHDVALQKLPVVFALDRAGLVGDDGPTHHGVLDIALLRPVPNVVLMAPSDRTEMERMLATGLSLTRPSFIRIPRGSVREGNNEASGDPLEVGKGRVLREGPDACILAYGMPVADALKAAGDLAADGVNVRVVDARFAKPLDASLIEECARAYDVMVTVEDGMVAGGFASGVLELLSEKGLVPRHFARLGVPDQFVEHGTPDQLRALCGYDAAGIAAKVRGLVAKARFKVA